jgi:hypothetical protein
MAMKQIFQGSGYPGHGISRDEGVWRANGIAEKRAPFRELSGFVNGSVGVACCMS